MDHALRYTLECFALSTLLNSELLSSTRVLIIRECYDRGWGELNSSDQNSQKGLRSSRTHESSSMEPEEALQPLRGYAVTTLQCELKYCNVNLKIG